MYLTLFHLFLWSAVGDTTLQRIVLPTLGIWMDIQI